MAQFLIPNTVINPVNPTRNDPPQLAIVPSIGGRNHSQMIGLWHWVYHIKPGILVVFDPTISSPPDMARVAMSQGIPPLDAGLLTKHLGWGLHWVWLICRTSWYPSCESQYHEKTTRLVKPPISVCYSVQLGSDLFANLTAILMAINPLHDPRLHLPTYHRVKGSIRKGQSMTIRSYLGDGCNPPVFRKNRKSDWNQQQWVILPHNICII